MQKRLVHFLAAAAATVLPFSGSPDAAAQSRDLERRLSSATRIECSFGKLVTGNWNGAEPAIEVGDSRLEATFFDIDIDEGTAEAGSDFGNTFISVRYAQGYLHFLQMSDAGPLRITTVLAQESANGRMKAVQTRHEYSPTVLPGFTSRPEMYVGDCAVS